MLASPAGPALGPQLSFPNRQRRGTLGDLTSFLSKNNGRAFGNTGGERTGRGHWLMGLHRKGVPLNVLTLPGPAETGRGKLPSHNVPGTHHLWLSKRKGNQPSAELMGMLLG